MERYDEPPADEREMRPPGMPHTEGSVEQELAEMRERERLEREKYGTREQLGDTLQLAA